MKYSLDLKVTAALLALALAIGGAGVTFPQLQMVLGLCSIAALAYFLVQPRRSVPVQFARPVFTLLALVLILPLLQLVPLPPEVWHQLPGRAPVAQLDHLLGQNPWRPLSLDSEGTIRAFLTLLPPTAVLVGCMRLPTASRLPMLWVITGFAVLGAILGLAQLASGGAFTPYPSAHLGFPIGLFVNRNHNAVMLLMAMPLVAALAKIELLRGRSRAAVIAFALSAIAVLAIVIIGTTSRMALMLLPAIIAGCLILLFAGQSLVRTVMPSVLALAGLAVIVLLGGGLERTLARFTSLHDSRFDYWTDVYWALGHYGIAGTGFGTFIPVYQTAESLTSVTPAILNHAHNDYVEILLEGGAAAVALLISVLGFLGYSALIKLRGREGPDRVALNAAAGMAIAAALLFSLVDFPLRLPALSCVFALVLTFLLPSARANVQRPLAAGGSTAVAIIGKRARLTPVRLACLAVLAGLAILVVQAGASARQLANRDNEAAAAWAPWSAAAHAGLADDTLFANGSAATARAEALAGLRISPIAVPAIRTLGILNLVGRDRVRGLELMQMATKLGWRDAATQLWAIDAAGQSGEPVKAVQRAEALYQQGSFPPAALLALLQSPVGQTSIRMLAADLRRNPLWRRDFLRSAGAYPENYLPAIERIFLLLAGTPQAASADESQPLMHLLTDLGRNDEAARVWASLHRQGLVDNGNFEQVDKGRGADLPANWDISDEDIGAISVERPAFGGSGNSLRTSQSHGSAPLVSQNLMLAPGAYSLSYRVHTDPGTRLIVRWELRCLATGVNQFADYAPAGRLGWEPANGRFVVPDRDCAEQRLAFERLGDIAPHEIWIDAVSLSPVTN